MKKIIIYLTILLLALTKVASSQVASIETKTGTVVNGLYSTTQVNVTLTGFLAANLKSIGAISMHIGYDPTIATFTGITNSNSAFSYGGAIIANASGNQINISWAGLPAAEITNDVAFTLNFNYTGGSCNLTFNQGCEIANGSAAVIQTTYQNGAITQPILNPPAVTSVNNTIYTNTNTNSYDGVYGVTNYLPITFAHIPINAAALSLNLSYDPNVLQYVGIDEGSLTGAIGNALNGVINIAWSSTTALPIDALGSNLKLKFNYLGGTSAVNFTGTNIISNANGVQIPIALNNGSVTQPSTAATVSISASNQYPAGAIVVPVNFAGYSTKAVGAVSMNIAYNPSKLNFTGVDQGTLSGIVSNANNGIVNLSWYNTTGVDNFTDFHLKFNYIGGTDTLKFVGQNQIAGVNGVTIPTTFNNTNGIIIQQAPPVTVNIAGSVASFANSTYSIPVNFIGIINLSAATMYVSFDNTKLTYTGITPASGITGVVANQDPTTKIVIINWSNTTPITSDGKFLDLKFTLNGTGSCDIPITFTSFNSNAGSLANSTGGTVPANWTNGNLNVTPGAPTVDVGAITQPTCLLATGSVILGGLPSGNWTITPGNITGTGTTHTITGLVASTYNYKVANAAGCFSLATAVVINAQPLTPTAPTVGTITQPTCAVATGSVVLGGLPSGSWTITPGNITGSGSSSSPISGLTTGNHSYQVTNAAGCISPVSANVVINSQPVTPAVPTLGSNPTTFCSGATVSSLNAVGTGIKWYTTLGGLVPLLGTDPLSSGDYYATQTVGACESTDRLLVAVTVNPTTVPGTVTGGADVCTAGNNTELTLGSYTGSILRWESSSDGTNWSSITNTLDTYTATNLLATTHFRAVVQSGVCSVVNSIASTITVYQNPNAPTGDSPQSFCTGGPHTVANLVATGIGVKWFSDLNSQLVSTDLLDNGHHYFASITSHGCESSRLDVLVNVHVNPDAPSGSNSQTFCDGVSHKISDLVVSGSNIKWYNAVGTQYTDLTTNLVTATHYYASQTTNNCESSSKLDVVVLLVRTPSVPTTNNAIQTFCSGTNPTLANIETSAEFGSTLNWHISTSESSILDITTALASGTNHYYASADIGACSSLTRLDVTTTKNTTPTVSSASVIPNTLCGTGNVTFTAQASAGTIKWYDALTSGNLVTPVPTSLSVTTTLYAEALSPEGCKSAVRTPVTVTVNTVPTVSSASVIPNTLCGTGTVAFAATASAGSINWYTALNDGTLVSPTPTSVNVTTTLYAEAISSQGCKSAVRTPVTVTVNTVPTVSSASVIPTTLCGTGNVTFTAQASAGTIKWYDALTSGNLVTPVPTSVSVTTTLFAEALSPEGCKSAARTPLTVTVNALPTGIISGTTTIINGQSTNLTLTVTGTGTISGTLSDGAGFSGSAPTIVVSVTPNVTTNYTIATLSDANCTATSGGLTGSAIVTVNPIVVNAKVILQGAYNTSTGLMNTTLSGKGYFPKSQPYSGAPWNYLGTENVVSIPANVVDWVLVELRSGTAASTIKEKRAGFVLKDGTIVGLDGISNLAFPNTTLGNYYIVVRHRNHLAIMSATAQILNSTSNLYDFTTAVNKSYGAGNPTILSNNKAMMILGDVNSDGVARATGQQAVNDLLMLNTFTGVATPQIYSSYDVNLDGVARSTGQVSVNDGTILSTALGVTVYQSRVPQ